MKRVLVAEDDPTIQLVLEKILRQSGYDVTITSNGSEALNTAKGRVFDAVLTDWMMPEMDGIELIRRVREECKPGGPETIGELAGDPLARERPPRHLGQDRGTRQSLLE